MAQLHRLSILRYCSFFTIDYLRKENTFNCQKRRIKCKEGCKEVAQLLLSRGADPNKADKDGLTPLSSAYDGGHIDTANILTNYGATPQCKDV